MNQKTFLPLIFIALISTSLNSAYAKTLYRLIDEKGNVSYSDKIPPKDSQREHAALNEKGRTILIREAAKTPEQILQLQKIRSLQKTKQALLEKQLLKDNVLLRTFQTEKSIDRTLDGKISMLDTQIFQTKKQTETLLKQLLSYQKNAAAFERRGKPISKKSLENINAAKAQYDNNQNRIKRLNKKKSLLTASFQKDKKRFIQLQKSTLKDLSINEEGNHSLALGEVTCKADDCKHLWEQAKEFTTQHAKTKIIFISDDLLLTEHPRLGESISLSLTKRRIEQEITLFLDIQCKNTRAGKSTCKSAATFQVAKQFNQLQPIISSTPP